MTDVGIVWQFLLASLQSIGTVVFIAGLGAVLGRYGYLDKQARSAMAGLVMRIGYPALLFTRLLDCPQCLGDKYSADSCPPCKSALVYLREAWVLILVPFVVVGIGLLVGRKTAELTGCPESLRSACMVAVACPNYFGMPLVVLDILGHELKRLGVITQDPTNYIAVLNLTAEVVVWTVGSYMLGVREKECESTVQQKGIVGVEDDDADVHTSLTSGEAQPDFQYFDIAAAFLSTWFTPAKEVVKLFFSLPPVLSVLVAVSVALIAPWVPIYSLFVDGTQQDSAPLRFVFNGLKVLGGIMVPLNLLVLGSNLSKGCDFSKLSRTCCIWIAVSKLIVMPAVMCAVVFVASRVVPPQRPEVWIITLMEGCTPTANSVATMVELSGKNSEAMSTAIAVQYYVAPLSVAAWLTMYSVLIKLDWFVEPF
jgi:predicted permease